MNRKEEKKVYEIIIIKRFSKCLASLLFLCGLCVAKLVPSGCLQVAHSLPGGGKQGESSAEEKEVAFQTHCQAHETPVGKSDRVLGSKRCTHSQRPTSFSWVLAFFNILTWTKSYGADSGKDGFDSLSWAQRRLVTGGLACVCTFNECTAAAGR